MTGSARVWTHWLATARSAGICYHPGSEEPVKLLTPSAREQRAIPDGQDDGAVSAGAVRRPAQLDDVRVVVYGWTGSVNDNRGN